MVRLYRTFSNYIFPGETKCAGCLCTSSGLFKHIEPRRTFSNHIITEIERCVEFSSGWFDCTEPSLSTSLQGKQGPHPNRIEEPLIHDLRNIPCWGTFSVRRHGLIP